MAIHRDRSGQLLRRGELQLRCAQAMARDMSLERLVLRTGDGDVDVVTVERERAREVEAGRDRGVFAHEAAGAALDATVEPIGVLRGHRQRNGRVEAGRDGVALSALPALDGAAAFNE